jgi:hypothetical protein
MDGWMDGWTTVFSNKIDQTWPIDDGHEFKEAAAERLESHVSPTAQHGVGWAEKSGVRFMARQSTVWFYGAGGGVVTIADNTPPTPPRATPEIIRDRLTTLLLLVLPKLLVLVLGPWR